MAINTKVEEVAPEAEAEAPQLSLADLAAAVQVIDVCSRRGAFEGSEMESVGTLRRRLDAFLQASKPEDEEGEGEGVEVAEAVEEDAA